MLEKAMLVGEGSMCFSNLCGVDIGVWLVMESLITSLAVSDAAQKYGGDSFHPICRQFGTTNFRSSNELFCLSVSRSMTYAKFQAWIGCTPMRQYPSLTLFLKRGKEANLVEPLLWFV